MLQGGKGPGRRPGETLKLCGGSEVEVDGMRGVAEEYIDVEQHCDGEGSLPATV